MSYDVIKLVRSKKFDTATLKAVLDNLASRGDDEGRNIYPSQATVAADTGLHRNTVNNALKALRNSGVLKRVGARGGRPGRRVIEYRIDLEALDRMPEARPGRRYQAQVATAGVTGRSQELDAALQPLGSNALVEAFQMQSPSAQITKEISDTSKSTDKAGATNTLDPEDMAMASAVRIYNEVARRAGWVRTRSLKNPQRIQISKALVRVDGVEGWQRVLERAARSDFLCGRKDGKPFNCSLTYLVRDDVFSKLQAGGFDNRPRTHPIAKRCVIDADTDILKRLLNDVLSEYKLSEIELRSPKNASKFPDALQWFYDGVSKVGMTREQAERFLYCGRRS